MSSELWPREDQDDQKDREEFEELDRRLGEVEEEPTPEKIRELSRWIIEGDKHEPN